MDRDPEVQITRAGAEQIERLAPLYAALQTHHTTFAPTLGRMPARPLEEAWRRRRERYAHWLAAPGSFLLVAEREHPIGFALATLESGYDGWRAEGGLGEIRDLVVLPERRGEGIGTLLLDAAEREFARSGVRHYRLNVLASNAQATRFYTRRGMAMASHTFVAGILLPSDAPGTETPER
jgi:GNAT superfamily N-acetyltransferase